MSTNQATGSRSTLKAFGIFLIALTLACFAWAHGGWFALFSFVVLVPGYFIATALLCGTEQVLMRRRPQFVPDDRIRKPFVLIVALLALQNIFTPVLTDNDSSIGYWSIFTGFRHTAEQSSVYNWAAGYYFLTNLMIMVAFVVFIVFVIKDIARKN